MKVVTSEELESTGYRCLFECVKKEGIEPVTKFIQDIRNLPNKEVLVLQTIAGVGNEIDTLEKNHKDIIKYLKEHVKELATLNITDENLYNTLINLINNESLISKYLENAKILEDLKIKNIKFVKDLKSEIAKRRSCYYCAFFPKNEIEINDIIKFYTDGEVFPTLTEEKATNFKWCQPWYNSIPFMITDKHDYTFVLKTTNKRDFYQEREIEIMDFGFNGSELPTEEEVQSYEIPKSLIKSYNEES